MTKIHTAGHFEMRIDGHKTTTYLKSVDGGFAKGTVIDDPIGADVNRVKHLGTVEIDPMSVEFGMSGATQVLEWIQGSWNRQWGRRNGQINHADFNLKQTFEHWFYDALMLETTIPALDGAAKDAAFIKCKFLPERIVTKQIPTGAGPQITPTGGGKQKMWMPSSFRFMMDHFDGMEHTNKIESFTIKQGVKKMYTGADRFPQIEPTNIQFPNIIGTIALGHADKLLKWHHDYVYKGIKDPKGQLTGSIEFLTPDLKSTVFRINLFECGLLSAAIEQSTANADAIKRVKFELFVGRMTLDGPGALGLE